LTVAALQLAKDETAHGRLKATTKSVRVTLRELHARYKKSLKIVKQLSALDLLNSPGVNRKSNACTADKILYNHAIELCQTAALDEIFGDQDGSFTKYQAAHTIFHSLNQSIVDVKFGDDKNRILKLQRAVEDRLTHLNDQGLGYMYDTVIATY